MAQAITIEKGPGKFDLMVSLFHGEGNDCQSVDFVLEGENGSTRTVAIFIWSMEREGTRDSAQWVIKGLTVNGDRFPASYSTKTRKGHYWPEATQDELDSLNRMGTSRLLGDLGKKYGSRS